MPTRRRFLQALSMATVCGAAGGRLRRSRGMARTGVGNRPPNVILVLTDDQGYGDLRCHGNSTLRTPNLDALYRASVRLTDFHVAPTCAPTRAALMTGRYGNRTGVWHTVMGRSLLRRDEVTMADVFAAAGYRTGIFGKWHLGDNYPFRPQDRGFQEVLVHGGGGVGQTPDFWGNDYFDDTYRHNGRSEKYAGYCTDIWFDGARQFIEACREQPFFIYLAPNAPHAPYRVSAPYRRLYAGQDVPNADFYGMITNIDENLGRLLGRLRDLNLERDTILLFLTDNGSAVGFRGGRGFNAGMRGVKGSEYDGGHRVPCFIRWPAAGLGGGRDVRRLTAHIDLLPTLMEMCGLPAPAGVKFDGTSLLPLLRGEDRHGPERVLVTDSQRIEHPEKWRKCAVMTERWRLVNGRELYDIRTDPGQRSDRAEEHPEVVRELRQAYEKWWAGVASRFGEYCEIVIGSDRENPACLTCHDWHTDESSLTRGTAAGGSGVPPWDQTHILKGEKANGFWAVEVARAGAYEFSLRRWPREVDAPIRAAIPGGRAISATKARLTVGRFDQVQSISAEAREVTFRMRLEPGKTKLQTWLTAADGTSRGAYFVYVRRVV